MYYLGENIIHKWNSWLRGINEPWISNSNLASYLTELGGMLREILASAIAQLVPSHFDTQTHKNT